MNRFIPPRAWLKNYKRTERVDRVNYDVKTIEVDLSNGDLYEFNFDEVELLRPTYFKDINNQEIYEGDILRWTSGKPDLVDGTYPSERYVVVFNFGRFLAVAEEKPDRIEELSTFMDIEEDETVKIVSTVYQTKVTGYKKIKNAKYRLEANQ